MFAFVLGFLSELARETGDWLDRILPAPRARRSLRAWRRRRPFWAALWVIAGVSRWSPSRSPRCR